MIQGKKKKNTPIYILHMFMAHLTTMCAKMDDMTWVQTIFWDWLTLGNMLNFSEPPPINIICLYHCLYVLCQLQIWDTAGQERFRRSMVEHYYRSVHAVIFVYDVTSLSSFESIPEWIDECSRHSVGPMVPRIMVGNKCDLRDRREVSTSAAQCLADSYNFPLFETSAKDPAEKEHVDAIFLTLAYRLKSHKPMRLKQLSESSFRQLWNQREQEAAICQC